MRKFLQENKDRTIAVGFEPGLLLTNNGNGEYRLTINGKQWMTYSTLGLSQEKEFASSVDLAYGDCVLSGLGLGILAGMLLNNPKVNSVTVYEVSSEVIALNDALGEASKKIKVVHQSMRDVRNIKCDCLLLDHYEHESDEEIIDDVCEISHNNDATCVWFWRAEPMIQHFKDMSKTQNSQIAYNAWAASTGICNLPNLTEQQLTYYISQWDTKGYNQNKQK
jgi:hypothetical protein